MNSKCDNRNPLVRSGVNQYERVLQALLPGHASVDERDDADLILFAKNYASQLKYFNATNVAEGDWQVFMRMDVSVTLASLVKLEVAGSFAYVKKILDVLKATPTSDETKLKNHFKVLFDFGFTLTALLQEYYQDLPAEFGFREIIKNTIQSTLPPYYDRLKKYYDEAISQGLIDAGSTFTLEPAPFAVQLSQDFQEASLAAFWTDGPLPAFTPTYHGASTSLKIKNTGTHNLFTGIFDQYSKTLTRLVAQARKQLDQTLTSFPAHSPHYGLFLTFIKLFRYAQEHVNTYTKRHLDLYYKEILSLRMKAAEPDQVHLTFELAKGKENHLLRKSTVFKAGKDAANEEIFYALTDDIVVNTGAVKSLKSLFVQKNLAQQTLQIFASPIANSEDGQGAKLASADKSWKVFGDAERTPARVGFVVASHYLYLREGIRTITFDFHAPAGAPVAFTTEDIRHSFSLQLTGEKGWVEVVIEPSKVAVHASKTYFSISIMLDGGAPPIVPYSEKIHQQQFATTLPLAKFSLKNALAKEAVWQFEVEKVGIKLHVTGIKDIAIQNDAGTLSPSKPFDLFGSAPRIGSSFIIGSKEIFLKTLQPTGNVKVQVNINWDNYSELWRKTDFEDTHKVDIYHLENAVWKETHTKRKLFHDIRPDIEIQQMTAGVTAGSFLSSAPATIPSAASANGAAPATSPFAASFMGTTTGSFPFPGGGAGAGMVGAIIENPIQINFIQSDTALPVSLPALQVEADYTANENYSVKSKWGFLKIELKSDFGHSTYADRLAKAAKDAVITSVQDESDPNKTTTTIKMDKVEEPFTPQVKEISLDYSCSTVLDFATGEEGAFLQLTPFGSKDMATENPRPLLPDVQEEGTFYIGIENFTPDQTLSLLFQVAEGSADPLQVKQELSWAFLGENNVWQEFQKEDIADATNDLTQSGIIRFSIPDKASATSSLFPEQLHWLRATVSQKTHAVCKLIAVVAQAAKAAFTDFKNTGNYFKNTLPAGTISKMVVSDSAVKKINQPYASFHGRVKEQDNHFYVRVSERLRHKNRAITMWDYERLVLEAFPAVYKAKCINHTHIQEQTSGTQTIFVDNERKPGHVLVVPIPDLKNKNAFDPLRPYTSLGLLTEIQKYLYRHISSHVNLEVRNPRFEEIQLEFKIKYLTAENEFYTKELKSELEKFLAPWAYDPQTDIEFGGKISKSVLIDFIEERPYVDFLSCVKMYQVVEGIRSADLDEAVATSARSVFVSVKSDDPVHAHRISFITENCNC
ncbi:baseplate J/gp47 family protein [Botryobacter ruber]|uniref:baseplate J/gp47 family protein n=1 Tax=Botryobacter ruber TaxID=2171629 RepID=UPI000E09F858|nr:baseplate J/gp47 family protein [Botryobacter ruber]